MDLSFWLAIKLPGFGLALVEEVWSNVGNALLLLWDEDNTGWEDVVNE